ncbi:MAG: 8-amino-7-oxononanoate synthase [Alphaproteobacteria bacterium]|nr:8-amino-7-oxononanoate synthase [Alphaproteobacteria bacterium]
MEGRGPTSSIEQVARSKLAELEAATLRRALSETGRGEAGQATRDERQMISFCCNDYLGLSQHPDVKRAASEAIKQFGAGAGASRLVTGNHPFYDDLEIRLARLKGTEAALVFGSGYLANLGIPPVLAGKGDLILADELSHASMRAGIQASPAESRFFRHNDIEDCRRILQKERCNFRHCLIMTEGIFSMDGDRAPLADLCDLAETFDAWLMTDDAHGLGVVGDGRGSAAEAGVGARIPLQMGTLSKAVGSYGGFICASQPVIDLLINRARSLIYATGLPPAVVAASCTALEIIEADLELTRLPMARARRFTQQVGLPDPESTIVPLVVGTAEKALAASHQLAEEGFLVTAIRPPTVPEGTARLRFTFAAYHSDKDVDRLAVAVRKTGFLP